MMKKPLYHSFLLSTLFISTSIYGQQCPTKTNIPFCPTSGTTLLDETYPTQAFVISNAAYNETKESLQVTQQFINNVMTNYDYKNVPQIILPITDKKSFDGILVQTKKALEKKNIPANEIEILLRQLSFVPTLSFTWQQDWFESFVNLETGSPVIRQIESYSMVNKPSAGKLVLAGEKCSISNGPIITTDFPQDENTDAREERRSFGSSEMGGNIEGAPGGFCLVGDNQGMDFTKQFCGGLSNIINLNVSWLQVGHVDEIFKIIPTNFNDGRPKECEFTLMSASPKKALELLANPMSSQSPFVDLDLNNADKDPKEIRSSRTDVRFLGNLKICSYISQIMKRNPQKTKTSPALKSVLLKLFMSSADAQELTFKELIQLEKECARNVDKISNYEIQEIIKEDEVTYSLNMAIEKSIEADKLSIKGNVLSRLPQCKKYYSEIDVPNLFYGKKLVIDPKTKKFVLPRPGTVASFLPNPTNSVLMNKTLVFPDTGNTVFNQYLADSMKNIKMKSSFIPTWDYAHIAKGNLHCVSHSITHCQPNPSKGKR